MTSENDKDFYKLLTAIFIYCILLLVGWVIDGGWILIAPSSIFISVMSNKLYEKYYTHPNWHRRYTKLRGEPMWLWGKLKDRKHVAKQFMLWPLPGVVLLVCALCIHRIIIPFGLIAGVWGWKVIADPAHWNHDYDVDP